MELFFLLLVYLGDLFENLPAVLAHFEFDLFLCFVEAHVLSVVFLQVLHRSLLLQVLP